MPQVICGPPDQCIKQSKKFGKHIKMVIFDEADEILADSDAKSVGNKLNQLCRCSLYTLCHCALSLCSVTVLAHCALSLCLRSLCSLILVLCMSLTYPASPSLTLPTLPHSASPHLPSLTLPHAGTVRMRKLLSSLPLSGRLPKISRRKSQTQWEPPRAKHRTPATRRAAANGTITASVTVT